MIDIDKLTDADKERNVIYHREWCNREVGKLSSWNKKYVFVRFKGPNGEACHPEDVSFDPMFLISSDKEKVEEVAQSMLRLLSDEIGRLKGMA